MPGARGETQIQTDEGLVNVLFTNRALAEVEQVTNRSAISMIRGFQDDSSGLKELVQLLRAGMQAAQRDQGRSSRPVGMGDVYDVLDQAGFATCMAAVVEAVSAVLSYGAGREREAGSDPNG